jgi:hypothetical protein
MVAFAGGHEAEADDFVAEFEDELRAGLVGDAEAVPALVLVGVGAAQLGEQPVAELADGQDRFFQTARRAAGPTGGFSMRKNSPPTRTRGRSPAKKWASDSANLASGVSRL